MNRPGATNGYTKTVDVRRAYVQRVPPVLGEGARENHCGRQPEGWGRENHDGAQPRGRASRQEGQRVLMVDLDPQANLTTSSGVDLLSLRGSIYNVLVHKKP